jgi:uncharacterized SAM-binding protein YcdF (DUF218 family)
MFYIGKALWFLLTPSNSLTLLVLLGVVAMSVSKRSRLGASPAALGGIGLLLCGLSPLGFWLATPLESRFPPPKPMPTSITGFIILGGGLRIFDTAQSDALSINDAGDRLIALADLARRYPAAKIVISGGSGDLFGDSDAEADLIRRHAETLEIDPARVLAENRSRTTYENALYTRDLVQPGDGEKWLLVTSAWHMPRAIGAFRQAGFPVIAYPVDFRSTGPHYAWRAFSEVARGLRVSDLMMKEWVGLVAYRLTGRTDEFLPSPDQR